MIRCELKAILDSREMTQKELAIGVNAHEYTVSRLCNNKTKKYDVALLDDICRFLRIDLSELLHYYRD